MNREDLLAVLKRDAANYANEVYSMRHHVAATFVQAYARATKRNETCAESLEPARASRREAMKRSCEGVQFAQRHVVGREGDEFFEVGIVRGRSLKDGACTVHVEATDMTAHAGKDYYHQVEEVQFKPGERFTSVGLQLLHNGVSMAGDNDRTWLPARQFKLTLTVVQGTKAPEPTCNLPCLSEHAHAAIEQHAHDARWMTGDSTTCTVKIIDRDKWPANSKAPNPSASTIFWQYTRLVSARGSDQ